MRDIAWIEGNHLVTRINERAHSQINPFADADSYQDFCFWVVAQSIAAVQQGRNLFAQSKYAIVRCIPRMSQFNRANTSLANMLRRDEIRLAHAKRDNIRHGIDNDYKLAYYRLFNMAHVLLHTC